MRKRKERTREQLAGNAHDLAEAHAVLEGTVHPTLDQLTLRTLHGLFSADCDALVSNQGFLVQFESGRRLVDYFSFVAPAVLSHLLGAAGAKTPCGELRAVPVFALKLAGDRQPRGHCKQLLWLRSARDVIRFALRLDSEVLRTAAWPPPVAPFRPPVPVYRDLDPARPCPHCAVALSRVRDLGYAMICPQCGRSFTSWDPSSPNPRRR